MGTFDGIGLPGHRENYPLAGKESKVKAEHREKAELDGRNDKMKVTVSHL